VVFEKRTVKGERVGVELLYDGIKEKGRNFNGVK